MNNVDAVLAHDGRIELPPGADPVEGIMRPPQRSVTVDLRTGQGSRSSCATSPSPAAASATPRSPWSPSS